MPTKILPLTRSKAWIALLDHKKSIGRQHLRKLFAEDPKRGERMTTEDIGLFLDYSKNRITGQTLKLLIQLANQAGLKNRIEAMFSGEKINVTEGRAVMHVALRAPKGSKIMVDGKNVVPPVHEVLGQNDRFIQPCA